MPKIIPINRNSSNYSNQTPVKTYLEAKHFRENRIWTLKNGELKTLFNGEYLTLLEFSKLFPIPAPVYVAKDNPDGSRNWINK